MLLRKKVQLHKGHWYFVDELSEVKTNRRTGADALIDYFSNQNGFHSERFTLQISDKPLNYDAVQLLYDSFDVTEEEGGYYRVNYIGEVPVGLYLRLTDAFMYIMGKQLLRPIDTIYVMRERNYDPEPAGLY